MKLNEGLGGILAGVAGAYLMGAIIPQAIIGKFGNYKWKAAQELQKIDDDEVFRIRKKLMNDEDLRNLINQYFENTHRSSEMKKIEALIMKTISSIVQHEASYANNPHAVEKEGERLASIWGRWDDERKRRRYLGGLQETKKLNESQLRQTIQQILNENKTTEQYDLEVWGKYFQFKNVKGQEIIDKLMAEEYAGDIAINIMTDLHGEPIGYNSGGDAIHISLFPETIILMDEPEDIKHAITDERPLEVRTDWLFTADLANFFGEGEIYPSKTYIVWEAPESLKSLEALAGKVAAEEYGVDYGLS